MKSSKEQSNHYKWGDNCEGWQLLKSESLYIIEELMPPQTQEKMHYHENAQQYFRILKGIGHFDLDKQTIELHPGEGVYVPPKTKHRLRNKQDEPLEVLIISQPSIRGDRTDVEK